MLSIQSLSKTYDNDIRALHDVDLEISSGLFGLLGPNGAGKSTLMRTIATLQDADAGSIRFEQELDVLQQKDAVRRILGYLPQEFGVYPRISAEALLRHLAVLKGISNRADREESVEALLRMTNLWDVRKQKLGSFSGGMRQRFGIAQALLGDPRMIVVDEPTAGLDPEERRRFHNILSGLGENVVVILSTHIVADVRELCTQMAIIDHGQVLLAGDPGRLIADLNGQVWRREIGRDELALARDRHRMISSRLKGGRVVIRVLSESSPGPGFEAIEPDLEDVYFATLAEEPTPA